MSARRPFLTFLASASITLVAALAAGPAAGLPPPTLQQQNEELFAAMQQGLGLEPAQLAKVRAIFARSPWMGQGNPAITVHPMTPEVCRQRRAAAAGEVAASEKLFAAICGGPNMAPLYGPAREKAAQAKACIDQFEFPNLPCAYPVVWVRAREAEELCEAEGKRLCDAHEWEGACAGSLEPPDYPFQLVAGLPASAAVARQRSAVNRTEDARKVWSYGPAYREGVCATGGAKTAGCNGGDFRGCGSNTYPAGSFPACRSPLGAYDLNGNAAEHMNLPLSPEQMTSRGSRELGYTEMKGSWFIFDTYKAHEDACRWRAPYWHGSRVMDKDSHHNYHLGFRCCKTLTAPDAAETP